MAGRRLATGCHFWWLAPYHPDGIPHCQECILEIDHPDDHQSYSGVTKPKGAKDGW